MGAKTKIKSQGWGNPQPFNTRSKFHFYGTDGRSLCGKWMRLGGLPEVEDFNDIHPDNCTACKKKIQSYRENQAKEAKA